MLKTREMAYPAPTKGCSKLSPDTAMLVFKGIGTIYFALKFPCRGVMDLLEIYSLYDVSCDRLGPSLRGRRQRMSNEKRYTTEANRPNIQPPYKYTYSSQVP